MDATIMRKRLDIQEAMSKPIKVNIIEEFFILFMKFILLLLLFLLLLFFINLNNKN